MPQAFVLAFVAGYADAAGFLRFDAFAGMMTGNTVLMSVALLHGAAAAAIRYALLLVAFFAGAVVAEILARVARPPAPALLLEAALLLGCDATRQDGAIFALVLAMGIQAGAMTQFGGTRVNTVVITANLQRFASGCVSRLWPGRGTAPRSGPFAIYGLGWVGYVLGACAGAAGFAFIAWPFLVPAALLLLVHWLNLREKSA